MKKSLGIETVELVKFLDAILNPESFSDYCPNSLQIEGKTHINKIAFAVSAQKKSIEKACEIGADALIVHHGLFWNFHGTRTITKAFAKRVIPLVKSDINLIAYHLPLDAHLEFGNAATLAKKIGLTNLAPFGDYKKMPTGVKGSFIEEVDAIELKNIISKELNHDVIHANYQDKKMVKTMGIITGGANSGWTHSLNDGLDSYLTGEMSEHDYHESRESGIHMYAGGHNATERYGIQAIMNLVCENFEVECVFIDSTNPA